MPHCTIDGRPSPFCSRLQYRASLPRRSGQQFGIGHATVKVFQERGWRLLTVSRQPFSEECRWPSARESHVQADLADLAGIEELADIVRSRLPNGRLHDEVLGLLSRK